MKFAQLGEIAEFKHGSTPPKSEVSYWGGDFPWASSKDIKVDVLDRTSQCVTPEAINAVKLPIAPKGSLLVVVRSGILMHTIPVAEVNRPMTFNQDIAAIIPDATRIHSSWLRLFIKSQTMQILQNGIKTGATVQSFRSGFLKGLQVPIVPLKDQIAVANFVGLQFAELRACIAAIERQISDGEELQVSILKSNFGQDSPVNVREQKPLFTEWRWHKLSNLARLESGHTPSRRHPEWWGGDVPWLALPDIRKLHGKYAYETTEYTNDAGLANSAARLLPVGTVCLSRTASVGFVTVLGRSMATSQDFCNWVCHSELDPEFLMYAFMASHDYLRELGSGAVHKTIYMPTIETFHVFAPRIDEQRRIARVLRERLAAAEVLNDGLKARLAEIERLPSRLLAAAFGSAG